MVSQSTTFHHFLTNQSIKANLTKTPSKNQKEHPMTLTKADIVSQLTNHLGFTKSKASEVTKTLLEIIKSTLESGEGVLISGFGKFCVKEKNERRGRNPATGDDMILDARKVVTFKCSGKLRERVLFQDFSPLSGPRDTVGDTDFRIDLNNALEKLARTASA